jgi:hypothetical protein
MSGDAGIRLRAATRRIGIRHHLAMHLLHPHRLAGQQTIKQRSVARHRQRHIANMAT